MTQQRPKPAHTVSRPAQQPAQPEVQVPPSSAEDERPRKSAIGNVWAFLNRDVRAPKWWSGNQPDPAAVDVPAQAGVSRRPPEAVEAEIVSHVDLRRIEALRFRREVLDWRDEFHYQVTEAVAQAKKSLTASVDDELSRMNVLRRHVFTKPAGEVLKEHIAVCVRLPMSRVVQVEQEALRKHLRSWFPQGHQQVTISVMWPQLEWDSRLALKFTASHRDEILNVLNEMMAGKDGMADRHRQWATDHASQLLKVRNDP